ncbi:pilus assembly protein TadG-related protein [Streptomyces sp. NPDC046942]|uniref:pilus assembly protein TadG-related protein n=1 Tax=Streptomyces sp. NPDC046942 TaxID=3155137 RepID=UPI0034050F25
MIPPRRDAGQAFPIYLTVVAGLLFLALAYLAVGQASVNRSGAQTAADSAALAAAQNERDQLTAQWVTDLLDPTKWQDIFDGKATFAQDPCQRARELATQNDAALNNCFPSGLLKYQVDVQTNKTVGHSVVPGTEDVKSKAHAIAEIEPLCTFKLPGGGATGGTLPQLTCKDKVWDLKPGDPSALPKPNDLFDVHLAD